MGASNGWVSVLKDVGVFGLGFGLIVWAVQKIINNSSERRFADYKSQMDLQLMSYKNQYDGQIEEYKSQLKFLNDRLSLLHTERLKIIKELNDRLVKLHSAMVRLVLMRPIDPDPIKENEIKAQILEDAQVAYAEYNNYILFNKLYFKKELSDKLDKIRVDYINAPWDIFEPERLHSMGLTKGEAYKESGQKVIDASKRIREEIPKAIAELEIEFRHILGVESKD